MSLYSDYLHEMGWGIVETDIGFATYKITGLTCYIQDVYIKPEYRSSKVSYAFADEITKHAQQAGCTLLTGTVDCTSPNWQKTRTYVLRYGFKITTEKQEYLVFSKEI